MYASRTSREPLIVTQSDIGAFKRCRRSWYYGGYLGLRLKEEPVIGPLTLGTRVHKALELYYTDGRDPVDAYVKLALDELDRLDESKVLFDRVAWQSENDLGRIMLEGYVEWIDETGADADYEILGAEKKLTYPLTVPGPYREQQIELRGKVDIRFRNLRTGARLVVDNKTTAHFSNLVVTADKDEQLLFYMLLERLADKEHEDDWVQGAMFNMLRKVKRGAQSKPPYYERLEIRHSDQTLRSFWTRLQGLLMDYVRVVQTLDDGYEPKAAAYPTPGAQCRYCPFRLVCGLTDDGSRVEDMISTLYDQRDPHERYELEPAAFLDEVAAN